MDNKNLAKEILRLVGGEKNVSGLVHCATRLRFTLKDESKADVHKLEETEGVLNVVQSGGQFQIVIGSHVSKVYEELTKITNFSSETSSNSNTTNKKVSITSKILETVSGSFSPLLPALAGAGMLKAVLTVLEMINWISPESGTFAILTAASNSVFYFLPVLLSITISLKLGANPYVGGAIGAALLEPTFTALQGASPRFIGIPVVMVDYASTVFPVFIAISIYALLDKFLKKVIYQEIQLFVVPMISLAIIVPLTAIIFGPIGIYVGDFLAGAVDWLIDFNAVISGAVVGGVYTFLTMFGLHFGFLPIVLENLANGGDPLMPMMATAAFAQIGVAVGIAICAKDKKLKAVAASTAAPGLLAGVTEPIIYGLAVRYRRTLIYIAISGAIGGAINAVFQVRLTALAFFSIFSIPINSPMLAYVTGIGVSFLLGVVLTVIFGFENKTPEQTKETSGTKTIQDEDIKQKREVVFSPLKGEVKTLNEVDDKVFSAAIMGQGIAVEPSEGEIVAPVNGVVTTLFETNHAIGITAETGAEILIHIGLDTVGLEGRFYTAHVKQGDEIRLGDLLVRFEINKIKEEGYQVVTPIIITNTDKYLDVVGTNQDTVEQGSELLTLIN